MAGRLSTTGMADRERTGEQIIGETELADQRELALPEPGGLWTLGLGLHLAVILLQDDQGSQQNLRTRK
jgi:hypothetical protein